MLPLVGTMDEALDRKPTVTVEGKQLEFLKLQNASVGQEFNVCSPAKIVTIYQDKGDEVNGIAATTRITFELLRMEVEPQTPDLATMYPNSPRPM